MSPTASHLEATVTLSNSSPWPKTKTTSIATKTNPLRLVFSIIASPSTWLSGKAFTVHVLFVKEGHVHNGVKAPVIAQSVDFITANGVTAEIFTVLLPFRAQVDFVRKVLKRKKAWRYSHTARSDGERRPQKWESPSSSSTVWRCVHKWPAQGRGRRLCLCIGVSHRTCNCKRYGRHKHDWSWSALAVLEETERADGTTFSNILLALQTLRSFDVLGFLMIIGRSNYRQISSKVLLRIFMTKIRHGFSFLESSVGFSLQWSIKDFFHKTHWHVTVSFSKTLFLNK